jgi:putative ABC transport system substrate-binding protein
MSIGLVARASPGKMPAMPVIGYLSSQSADRRLAAIRLRAFWQGLGEMGFVESRNVAIEYRSADGQYDRLPALIADLAIRLRSCLAATWASMLDRAVLRSWRLRMPAITASG